VLEKEGGWRSSRKEAQCHDPGKNYEMAGEGCRGREKTDVGGD